MSYLVLARKWRPMRFEDLVGQDHVARTLKNAIDQNRVAHAFLFTGVRGVGKTTSARILAKALNCMRDPRPEPGSPDPGPTPTPCLRCPACVEIAQGNDLDVREIDGASYTGVDDVRKLQDGLAYRPARDRYKIFIVDEVHMLSQNAWNAFLKTLEEPPPHVKFIFATTEVHKVPVTILSRVQRFDFKLISAQLIAARLRYVLEQEKIRADDAALALIAREAAGSMRDAMSLLDQVIAWGGDELRGDDVARVLGVASHRVLYDLATALVDGEPGRCLELVSDLANEGHDLIHVARDLLLVLRHLVVAKVAPHPGKLLDLPEEEARDVERLAARAAAEDLMRLHQGFADAFDSIARGGQPRAALEMALVRLAYRPPLGPPAGLLQRLGELGRRPGAQGARPRPAPAPQRPHAAPLPDPPAGGGAARPREPHTPPRRRPEPGDDRNEPPIGSIAAAPIARASAPPAPTAPAPEVPTDPDELLRLIVARVAGERPELAAKLEHAVLVESAPGRIVLGWPPESVFGSLVAAPENTALVERAATAVIGTPTRVVHEHDSERTRGRKTLSRIEAENRERQKREAYERMRKHPRVVDAVEILGARLRDLRLARMP
nr:MAG: DNA polymerase III subunit gamma/tau [Pseudomonadota bacterium]